MIKLTDANFDTEINNAKKLVLVDFYADWCDPCTMLSPILEKVAEDMKDHIVLMKANVDETPINAGKFRVEGIPAVFLFKDGKAISGFVGLRHENAIKDWLKENMPPQPAPDNSAEINKMIEGYEVYAKENNLKLNPDRKTLERIMKGLLANEEKFGSKYCPCRRVVGDKQEDAKKICPCIWHKDEVAKDGHCFCNLFVKP